MATSTIPSSRPHTSPKTHLNHLLHDYTTSHPLRSPSPLPASSRQDPKSIQRPPPNGNPFLWGLAGWIGFIRLILVKGIHIAWSLISHFLFGPARKSWGYRMTLITSVMRNISDHSSLADIVLVRRLISLNSLLPLPTDAVITPITFTVPRQRAEKAARGFLRDLDRQETGSRELTGEWVVGTEVWKRLKAERRARQRISHRPSTGLGSSSRHTIEGGSESPVVDMDDSESVNTARKSSPGERVIYYVHGGAYYVGNAATHRMVTIGVSKACNCRVFAITYRLAPEHVFPLPLHDVLLGYLRLLAPPLSIPPENIIIAGDSAGGGLSLALCMYLRDEGYSIPAGLILMSPWVDLTMSCGSWDENVALDVVPRPQADDHLNPVACYLGAKGISTYLTHPYASPLFGDLSNLPPMLIQSGDSEVLRDEITLLAHKATLSGINVTHELYEDMVHVFQMFSFLPAAEAAIKSIGRWVRMTLPKIEEEVGKAGEKIGVGVGSRMDGEMMEAGSSKVVNTAGEEVGRESLPHGEEILAAQDESARRGRRVPLSSLALDLGMGTSGGVNEEPTIDVDSLPSSSSGSPTPTNSRSRSPTSPSPSPSQSDRNLFSIPPPRAPRLRRSLTEISSHHTNTHHTHTEIPRPSSPTQPQTQTQPQPQPQTRHRRRTQGEASRSGSISASLHFSPTTSTYAKSNPVSPSPSERKRLRSPTLSSITNAYGGGGGSGGGAGQTPRMRWDRERDESHEDLYQLVEGYVEGGAANETVVYSPGGEVRSVGVLGGDEEEED